MVNQVTFHPGPDEIAFGTAVNVAPIDEAQDYWIDISPYGEHPNEWGVQVVDRSAAEEMVAAHNSFLGKLGRLFRGIPIYRGHPYQRPDLWPDDTRYGRVNALRAGDHALQGKVVWNDLGQKNKEQGYWVYPSPGWAFKRLGNGKIRPVRLDHIGLTNNPNISQSVPVTNARAGTSRRGDSAESGQTETRTDEKVTLAANVTTIGQKATFRPGTSEQDVFTLETRAGRARLFEKRIGEILAQLKAAGKSATLDEATYALRTSDTPEDRQLLEAMGVATGHHANELLHRERMNAQIDAQLQQSARGTELSAEAKAALKAARAASAANSVAVNDRRLAFNRRLDQLMEKGFTIDQAINQMRANPRDSQLLEEMNQ